MKEDRKHPFIEKRQLISFLLALAMVLSIFTGCKADADAGTVTGAALDTLTGIEVEYSEEDMDGSWDPADATLITMDGSTFTVDGSGTSVDGSKLTITAAGTYAFSGTLTDGQILVDAGKKDTVRIVLNGAEISCSDNAGIYSMQSKKTIITLAEGTVNSVSDGSAYTYENGADEPDAAIFGKDDLTVNGSGALTVHGNYNNGITSKDDLVITGGEINLTAFNDGLRGRDSVAINGGAFTITANGDGIQSNNDEDPSKGWISLDGGAFTIIAGNDGVQAETLLQVTDGTFGITTGGGSANASTDKNKNPRPQWGQWDTQTTATAVTEEDTASAKGLKSSVGILLKGGDFSIDSSDDSIHSNGDVLIKAGTLTLTSGDDGIHADAALTLDGGTLDITKSYEGLEGASITVNGGTLHLIASDDGLNAAGGADSSSQGERPGENSFAADAACFIRITGGNLSIDAAGDGIDSNGSLYIDGGTIQVSGPTDNGNGPIDYTDTFEITGGILAIAGSSGMAQSPSDTSAQNSILVYYTSVQAAGTMVTLADESGNSIFSFTPLKEYQSILISSPDLAEEKTYSLYTGGTNTGEKSDGLIIGGSFSGGTKLTEITITDTATRISQDGTAVTGGMGGAGGMNGGPGGQRSFEQSGQQPPLGEDGGQAPSGTGRPQRPSGENGQMPPSAGADSTQQN
ncbi:carbohydrate-binding domain-containing protein [Sinanaerobacter chloroacetimidivorans]|uniref:carbohydrate-binding domain-containing protein n=1 Tax=Sinanaerobacter chloroacetimidivorans TaxID=2818044 RepID=UPI001D04D51E|nr:carbohydrate-binding domain-containing protein [Sinanaerobacter chloroacetimidivorans]